MSQIEDLAVYEITNVLCPAHHLIAGELGTRTAPESRKAMIRSNQKHYWRTHHFVGTGGWTLRQLPLIVGDDADFEAPSFG